MGISYDDIDEPYSEIIGLESVTETQVEPQEPFKFFGDSSSTEHVLTEVRMGYRVYGVDYGIMVNSFY